MAQTKPPKSALKRLAELEGKCLDLENQLAVVQAERNIYKEKYEDILLENIRLQDSLKEIRERLRRYEPIEQQAVEEIAEEAAEEEFEEVLTDCFADCGFPLLDLRRFVLKKSSHPFYSFRTFFILIQFFIQIADSGKIFI